MGKLISHLENPSNFNMKFSGFSESTMPEFQRPTTYLGKLEFAQRVIKAATFRTDQRQAVRELCEAMTEIVLALIEREQGHATPAEGAGPH